MSDPVRLLDLATVPELVVTLATRLSELPAAKCLTGCDSAVRTLVTLRQQTLAELGDPEATAVAS
jgi:hypothetical protein